MSTKDNSIVHLKLLVIGCSGVGKSCLIQRLVNDKFEEGGISATVGYMFMKKNLQIDQVNVQLDLYDTAGEERFNSLMPNFYREADGALLVYDVTRPETLRKLNDWNQELDKYAGREDVVKYLVGNKVDLRTVPSNTFSTETGPSCLSEEDGRSWAKRNGLQFFEASAKTAYNVKNAFIAVAKLSREYQDALTDHITRIKMDRASGIIQLGNQEPKKEAAWYKRIC